MKTVCIYIELHIYIYTCIDWLLWLSQHQESWIAASHIAASQVLRAPAWVQLPQGAMVCDFGSELGGFFLLETPHIWRLGVSQTLAQTPQETWNTHGIACLEIGELHELHSHYTLKNPWLIHRTWFLIIVPQILTANRAGKSPSGGSAGGDSWVSSPVTLALICAPVFWRRSVFCCEDWNWISGIAGSISGISSRIWCWIFMDFMLKIGISMDFMQDLYHWNLDFTMKLWCLKTHGTPWDRSWHDLSRSEVRLPGLHGGKVRRADLSSGIWSGLFSDPSHPGFS